MDLHHDDAGNVAGEAAYVVVPILAGKNDNPRSADARLEEAVSLAQAIRLRVVGGECLQVNAPQAATLVGAGKVSAIRATLDGAPERAGLVIVDETLSPSQHRNLEKAWDAKVLDRTALILEIFGERAKTAEGRLQVDLAHLTFQRSRLVRSWTHLERQRGGAGFLGGPGERQIESDRRSLAVKIGRLKNKLEQVRKTRTLQRAERRRSRNPVVALVGYTNAGKSTLFNKLTDARVFAKDLLFATLDTTVRGVELPSGQVIGLSDTVGFVSNLPTQLVAAFRATLEEVAEADIIVHVRDFSHPDTRAQRADVLNVLEQIGIDPGEGRDVVEVLNKMDQCNEDQLAEAEALARGSRLRDEFSLNEPACVLMSARDGEGVDAFVDLLDQMATQSRRVVRFAIPAQEGAARAFLYAHGEVLSEEADGAASTMTVRVDPETCGRFSKLYPGAVILDSTPQGIAAQ